MKLISTKTHAWLDYICAGSMIGNAVFLNPDPIANYILMISGTMTLLYSTITHYEFSLLQLIPLKKHFRMDILSGSGLIIAPWIFEFEMYTDIFFWVCGGIKILSAVVTHPKPVSANHVRSNIYKLYDMPVYGKMEKFPRMKL